MFTKNIICPVCGGSCDDIQVELGDGEITVRNACKMGNAKFQEVVSSHRLRDPMIKENGELKKADWNDAITKAAEILTEADRPLLFLGSETSCEAQEIGLHIGEYLGAAVDSNATICHGPTVMESRSQASSVRLRDSQRTGRISPYTGDATLLSRCRGTCPDTASSREATGPNAAGSIGL